MDIMTLCNILKVAREPLCSEILNEELKELMNSSIYNITENNDISHLIESFKNKVNINLKLHSITFDLGVILGILESNDNILLNLVDKIYFVDDDTPVELTFVRHLKDDLKSANEDLHKYFTKIHPKYENLQNLETFESLNNSLNKRNAYLVIANKDFNYCSVSGYVSLINAICNDFIRKYKDLDFAEVNAVNIQNVGFLIGLSFGFMKAKNIEDRIIMDRFNYIFAKIRTF